MKKFRNWILMALVLCMVLSCVIGPASAIEDETRADLFDRHGFEYIPYNYTPGGIADKSERTAEFAYSDAMLLADANEMSIDLVKASVAVAFTAYQKKNVDAVLKKMGFDALDNSGAYDIVKNLTIDDNDHVAYTIARKTIEHDGQTYVAYCIPVKGTSGNAEWFSNFNLGEEVSVHKGFLTASNRVYDAMRKAFSEDGVDADHRIVWITGHSRGAACANIIAGWLAAEEFARRERTFAYTYACPSVSTKANETLTNIYNFNNIGDVVTMLPLTKSGWNYKRNGQTIILDLDHVDNFKQRFRTVAKEAYVGQLTNTNYEGLLGSWLPDRDDYFEFRNQLITQVVAYAFGGNTDCTLGEFLKHLCDMTSGDIAKKISACQSIPDLMDLSVSMGDIYARLIRNGMKFYEDTKAMSEEDFRGYVQNNAGAISELEEASGLVITSAAVFPKAVEVCEQLQEKALGIKKVVDLVTQLFIDSNGDPLPAFMQAHDHTCYITWINSMFYGYQGWMGNTDITEVTISGDYSEVGKQCFEGCSQLNILTVEDGVYHLGDRAFASVYSLWDVTMPVDIRQSFSYSHPFSGTDNVGSIRYTYGRTGIMEDRTEDTEDRFYQHTLEYASRRSLTEVSFDEDIGHVGAFAFYSKYDTSVGPQYQSVLETVELPSTLETVGDSAFRNCTKLSSIALPEGLMSLGAYGFYDCDSLTDIQIPESLTKIPDHCFGNCGGITSLTIPDTVTELGEQCFGNMSRLTDVTMPVDVGQSFSWMHPFAGTGDVSSIRYTYGRTGIMEDRTEDTNDRFYQHTLEYASRRSLTEVSFDEGIGHVGAFTFYSGYDTNVGPQYQSVLETVELPSTLETVGDSAFRNCMKLSSVALPEGLMSLGAYGFYDCDSLTDIQIPESLTKIPDHCFDNCGGITSLTIPDTVTELGEQCFGNMSRLTDVTMPVDVGQSFSWNHPFAGTGDVSSIRYTYGRTGIMEDRTEDTEDRFYQHTLEYASRRSLTEVSFDEGIAHVGAFTFYSRYDTNVGSQYQSVLETVELPSTLETVGDSAFRNCMKLSSIALPEGLMSLGAYGFYDCDSLTDIQIPESLTKIPDHCFDNCGGITSLTIPDTVTELGEQCFGNMSRLTDVTMPVDVGQSFSWNHPFAGTGYVSSIRYTYGRTGIMEDRTEDTNDRFYQYTLEYASRRSLTEVSFDEGIGHVGAFTFYSRYDTNVGSQYQSVLETVELPSTLETVGDSAFRNCTMLSSIALPEGLMSLGAYGFYDCDSLTDIQIPESLTKIPDHCFDNCGGITSLTIPDTVTELGEQCFGNMSRLTDVTMPVDVGQSFSWNHPFAGTGYVSSIRYTYGRTGIMEDRTEDKEDRFYQHTLEYASRMSLTEVSFDEGIGHVGAFAFYSRYDTNIGSQYQSVLETVELPSTLESIGSYAFAWCGELASVRFSGDVPWIGENAFAGVTAVCMYPDRSQGWTADALDGYGGDLTCKVYCVGAHDFVDGMCTVCGEVKPVTDPGLVLRYPTLSFEDEIIYNVYYTVEDLYSVVEMGLMILPSRDDGATVEDALMRIPGFVTNGAAYLVRSEGIPAANMGDTVYFKVYAKLSDGTYAYSGVGGYNAKAYASTVLGGNYTNAMKSLVVAMVNYGAEAQRYFGHNTDKPVNGALSAQHLALVAGYDEAMIDPVVAADGAKTVDFVRVNSDFKTLYPSVSFDGAFAVNLYCAPAIAVDGAMTLYWWDVETMDVVEKLSEENALGSMEMVCTDGTWWGQVAGIAAKDMDKTYYVSCVFESGGQRITTGIIPYSLGKYCEGKAAADGDAQQAFAQATAVYGYYAKRYFSGIA